MSATSKTGNLISSPMLRQYELDLMARFMEIKTMNPRLTQNEIAKELVYSSATVKRYKIDIDMPSPYKLQSNTNKRKPKISNDISNTAHEPKVNPNEPKRAQKHLTKLETSTKSNKRNKNILKSGSVQENIEFDDEYLEEILHNDNS